MVLFCLAPFCSRWVVILRHYLYFSFHYNNAFINTNCCSIFFPCCYRSCHTHITSTVSIYIYIYTMPKNLIRKARLLEDRWKTMALTRIGNANVAAMVGALKIKSIALSTKWLLMNARKRAVLIGDLFCCKSWMICIILYIPL